MRLAAFITQNIEAILEDWDVFARGTSVGAKMDELVLRDHAEEILRATVRDMESDPTPSQQSDKSTGKGDTGEASAQLDGASQKHGFGRVASGFDLAELVAEYRALRASVLRLWRKSQPVPDVSDLDDMTRFNESIDQSLTKAVHSYSQRVGQSRQMFLAILGHDLRNPLNSVMMSAQWLSRPGRLDAEASDLASKIASGAASMAGMVSDLLDFLGTALGAGMPTVPVAMDLGRLCGEGVDEIRTTFPARTIRFRQEGDLSGHWDAARLRQAVSNLLGNAIHYGGAGPVDLSVIGEGASVRLVVHNGGPPIPPELLLTIFDPLVRDGSPEAQRHRRQGSIGLGLYIVREVVIAHGGTIDVQSSEEAGTVFSVCLPRRRGTDGIDLGQNSLQP